MADDRLAQLTILPGATVLERRVDGWWMLAPGLDVCALARLMQQLGFRLSTLTGLQQAEGESAVLYHYCRDAQALNVQVHTTANALPSITPIDPAAAWAEREIHDLYGVEFQGHPQLARLIRPVEFAPGMFRD